MDILNKLIFALMLLSAVGIVILVLLQHGKGADMGTGFGAGASGSLFGATGSANFLSRTTAILAALFFSTTLALSWFSTHTPRAQAAPTDLLPQVIPAQKADNPPAAPEAPAQAAPAPAAPAGKAGEIPK